MEVIMAAITHSSQLPFNFNAKSWTFKESIFDDLEERELMDKPALPLKRWNYKGHEEMSVSFLVIRFLHTTQNDQVWVL
jgi:hypothetical protein